MTRPYEYFATCGGQRGIVAGLSDLQMSGCELTVETRVHRDYNSGGIHVSYFIPAAESILPIARTLVRPKLIRALIRNASVVKPDLHAFHGERRMAADRPAFTGRVTIYSDSEIGDADWSALTKRASSAGIDLIFRGPEFARARAKAERPLAFILYDPRDKDSFARPLAEHLRSLGAPVWFDEFSTSTVASLRERIDRGMRECPTAIVFVSQRLLASTGSASEELDALFLRQADKKDRTIIPVLCGVERAEVEKFSGVLAGLRAFTWDPHVDPLAALLFRELTGLDAPLLPL